MPTEIGYIEYVLTHSVDAERYADTWRVSGAYSVNDELDEPFLLGPSAEWDMAVCIKGRDDFIGGFLHGDEKVTGLTLKIDGVEKEITSLTDPTPFDELRMTVSADGFDPADHVTKVLIHDKEYIINADGVAIEQRVEWLRGFALESCFLAMLPPYKNLTDTYYTDIDPVHRPIESSNFRVPGARAATLYGKESGYSFSFAVPKYPYYESGQIFFVSDNSGRPYNKMYLPVCRGGEVNGGDVWESRTEYNIERRDPCHEIK